jgi:hypothetical protein
MLDTIDKFIWDHFEGLMIGGFAVMVIFAFLGIILHAADSLKLDCSTTVYSNNWTLEYLRNVTSYCSNGGIN